MISSEKANGNNIPGFRFESNSNSESHNQEKTGMPAFALSKNNTVSNHTYSNKSAKPSSGSDGNPAYQIFDYVYENKKEKSEEIVVFVFEEKKESKSENKTGKSEVLDSNQGSLMKNVGKGDTD